MIVDASLSVGAKSCQAIHAAREYASMYPFIEGQWYANSNTIVLLQSDDLEAIVNKAARANITFAAFYEPDFDPSGVLTAVCLGPDGKRLCRKLPLLS